MRPSDEATREGLRLAREAGEAYQRMVSYFLENVADNGATMQVGDYRVGLALEGAEPLWYPQGDGLELAEPPQQANLHVEVVVTDKDDGRFIPELAVAVTLEAQDGSKVGTWDLPFLWHPTLYHYGRNVGIPHGGKYTVRVSIAAPTFSRHDKVNGRRYMEPVLAEFRDLEVRTKRESR
jgi:hypothetical protein